MCMCSSENNNKVVDCRHVNKRVAFTAAQNFSRQLGRQPFLYHLSALLTYAQLQKKKSCFYSSFPFRFFFFVNFEFTSNTLNAR